MITILIAIALVAAFTLVGLCALATLCSESRPGA